MDDVNEPSTAAWEGAVADRICSSIAVRELMLSSGLPAATAEVAAVTARSVTNGGTVFFMGNGGSATDAGHLAGELLGRFYEDRRPLAAVALADQLAAVTAIANDYGYEQVFSRQLAGLGRVGDVAFGLTTSGNSANVIKAFEVASAIGITTVAMTGEGGGKLAGVADHWLEVPSVDTPRIQECHMLLGHTICELVETELVRAGAIRDSP